MKILKKTLLWFTSLSIIFLLLVSTTSAGSTPTNTEIWTDNETGRMTITYGQKTLLWGFFWHTSNDYEPANGIDNKDIEIWRKSVNASEFDKYLFSATSYSITVSGETWKGLYDTFLFTPTRNYDYGSFFDGTDDPVYADSNNGESSTVVTIYVRVAISHSAKRNSRKRILRLAGKVKPTHNRKRVIIKIRKKGSRRWSTLARLLTNSSSNYLYNWRYGKKKGVYYTKAIFPADSDHVSNTSKTVASRL